MRQSDPILARLAPVASDHVSAPWPRLVRLLIIVPASVALWVGIAYLFF